MLLNRRVKILFFSLVIVASLSYYFDLPNSTYTSLFHDEQLLDNIYSETNYLDYPGSSKPLSNRGESLIIDTPGCQLPDTYSKHKLQKGETWKNPCQGWTFTFMKNFNILTLNLTKAHKKNVQCCYNAIIRESDSNIRIDGPCIPVVNEIIIDRSINSVQVKCYSTFGTTTEFHYVLHPSADNTEKLSDIGNTTPRFKNNTRSRLPHVVIIGIDSVSRQHLHQYMPRTRRTLERYSAIEFHGFNKVGENTSPNSQFISLMHLKNYQHGEKYFFKHSHLAVMPLLTGYSLTALPCNHSVDSYVDSCPFLWHELREKTNYFTGLLEDAPKIAIFNYKKVGFKKQPTDFYLRPLMWMANIVPGYSNSYTFPCVGSGKTTESFMLRYVQDLLKYSDTDSKRPLFILTWLTSLAHENTQKLERNDGLFANFFEKMSKEHPNSYIIFMSDHGYRYANKRNSRNGWFNEKLPFLFIKPPMTEDNVVRNQKVRQLQTNSRKLVTVFDIHRTLREILNLPFEINKGVHLPGQSLFHAIPSTRTCKSAGIPKIFCTCTNLVPLRLTSPIILQSALASVQHINTQLPGKCKKFQLARITGAALLANYTSYYSGSKMNSGDTQPDKGNKTIELAIGFRVKPGQFDFESTVRVITYSDNDYSPLTSSSKRNEETDRMNKMNTVIQIKEKILRTSAVEGKRTWCCANNSFLELYCHCDFFKFVFWFYWLRD